MTGKTRILAVMLGVLLVGAGAFKLFEKPIARSSCSG
jgi:hypothetical protein